MEEEGDRPRDAHCCQHLAVARSDSALSDARAVGNPPRGVRARVVVERADARSTSGP